MVASSKPRNRYGLSYATQRCRKCTSSDHLFHRQHVAGDQRATQQTRTMYFAYGWPKVLSVGADGSKEDVVSMALDSDFCLIVFTGSAQIWAGGQHRVKLGSYTRSEESTQSEGLNKQAFWCSSRRLLAVLVLLALLCDVLYSLGYTDRCTTYAMATADL